jgi:hypothetical protein
MDVPDTLTDIESLSESELCGSLGANWRDDEVITEAVVVRVSTKDTLTDVTLEGCVTELDSGGEAELLWALGAGRSVKEIVEEVIKLLDGGGTYKDDGGAVELLYVVGRGWTSEVEDEMLNLVLSNWTDDEEKGSASELLCMDDIVGTTEEDGRGNSEVKMLRLVVADWTTEEGGSATTELLCVADDGRTKVDEDEMLKLFSTGCDEGTTTNGLVFVIATGSPSEKVGNEVSKLLVTIWMDEEEAVGISEVLCEFGTGSRPNENVGKDVSKLLRSDGKEKEGRGGNSRLSGAGVDRLEV